MVSHGTPAEAETAAPAIVCGDSRHACADCDSKPNTNIVNAMRAMTASIRDGAFLMKGKYTPVRVSRHNIQIDAFAKSFAHDTGGQ